MTSSRDDAVQATTGLELQEGRAIPRRQVFSWALWDWATQPFNTVILTFIFTALYLTTDVFLDPAVAALGEADPRYQSGIAGLASGLGLANTVAGILIALVAPVLGQRSDGTGRRKRALAISTLLVVLSMAALFFVQGSPGYFVLGVALVAIGSVFNEIAGVHYNAMLVQVSTPKTVGRVSGLGWGFGYLGGILALVIVVVAYSADWFGLPQGDGLPFRVVALGCAVWTVLFGIPIFRNVPELPAGPDRARPSILQSYVLVGRHIVRLWRESRTTFWFLLASAVFRDGLAGVFAYGAVIASAVFGFGFLEVVGFGIAANLVAGVATIVSGRFDDRFGPKVVIVSSLTGLVISGLAVFALRDLGDIVFWVGGLLLCLFVGPAQSASRSFLARVTPAGREGEVFGLYATTGRAASFLSPALWTALIVVFGATAWGILGIVAVLLVGLVLMLLVREPRRP
ncbi:MAG: transporter [Naasia sp.]|jgi:UMF1 family MFS transporter|uniref:MFS transporter n=1 Tax=Naasia sp. TaxID=2546198 RepID=UPI00261BBB9D|nr:MFS transporter [Naasia sp.]MCU1570323.1 transporter [Naasia sp.]